MKRIISLFVIFISFFSFSLGYTDEELEKQAFIGGTFRILMGIGMFLIVLCVIEHFRKKKKKEEKQKEAKDNVESQALELLIEKMQKK